MTRVRGISSVEKPPSRRAKPRLAPPLPQLASETAKAVARDLRAALIDSQYHEIMHGLQSLNPVPIDYGAYQSVRRDRVDPDRIHPEPSWIFDLAYGGEPVSRRLVSGKMGIAWIRRALFCGLLVQPNPQQVQMNQLSISAFWMPGEEPVFFLADCSFFSPFRSFDRRRVYSGADTYFLNKRLHSITGIRGQIMEACAGSFVHPISLLLHRPEIDLAWAWDIDRRAVHVGQFNAYLNGVEKRARFYGSRNAMEKDRRHEPVSLAFVNPPYMQFPQWAEITAEDRKRLPRWARVRRVREKCEVFVADLYDRANVGGGIDGLNVTRSVLPLLHHSLGPGATCLIWGQFSGDEIGPTHVIRTARDSGFASTRFEPFQDLGGNMRSSVADYLDAVVGQNLPDVFPGLKNRPLLTAIKRAALSQFKSIGTTHIHAGLLTVVKPAA